MKNPGKAYKSNLWKPSKDGEKKTIRLIEYPYSDDPFVELFFHYNIGKGQSILCPKKNYGKTCPVCDFAVSLISSGSEEDKTLAKGLWPKQRIYAAMIDRDGDCHYWVDDTPSTFEEIERLSKRAAHEKALFTAWSRSSKLPRIVGFDPYLQRDE